MQCDYSIVMPFVTRALLEKRARFERWAERMGHEALFEKHPAARGYLRDRAGYRLFDKREGLLDDLKKQVRGDADRLRASCDYPLADLPATDPSEPSHPGQSKDKQ